MTDLILIDREEHIFKIGINRPKKRNAFNAQMYVDLCRAYADFENDTDMRVALIYCIGDHFCGGLELDEIADPLMNPDTPDLFPEGGIDPWGIRTERVNKPVILAVEGYTLTLAIELMLASEIVIAADTAKFAQIEVSKGLYPIGGATTRWPLASGYQNAMRYLLTGDMFDAEEAKRIGLVQDIVAPDELHDHAMKIAKRVAAQAPLGIKATLKTARLMQNEGQQVGADAIFPELHKLYFTEDWARGLKSFEERNDPTFVGK